VMARRAFKQRWTRVIPAPLERSTFVLAASACLALLYWLWRPLGTTVLWDLSGPPFDFVFVALCLAGFAIVVLSTFMIDHFDLFGLRQVWYAFRNRPYPTLEFSAPALYKAVRHPIYLGFIIAFWATPIMTLGHLVFAVATTGYILVAIQLEERDLVHRYGETYRQYRRQVGMLLPNDRERHGAAEALHRVICDDEVPFGVIQGAAQCLGGIDALRRDVVSGASERQLDQRRIVAVVLDL